ncbi:MAG TPA: PhzF family phenazine biosynthesis protein [Actinomycetota bacterium]|nr:PhzF family phenazine biosynthesis protein [Actinomycetota bacterium]
MRIPFVLADVFTDRPLAGNQLMVVTDASGLTGDRMQELAREIGFSESTFVLSANGDRYAMRIFSPGYEMPFAGHPTLGTAFVLATDGRIGTTATQEVPAGEFAVEVDLAGDTVKVRQLAPEFGDELTGDHRDRVAAAIGLNPDELDPGNPPQPVSTGLRHLMVPIASPDAVVRAEMRSSEVAAINAGLGCDALYLFAVTDEGAKARLFAPGVTVSEDPATGSAAGPCGAYMAARGLGRMPGSMTIRQGDEIGRPSTLHVTVEPEGDSWSVLVGGGVRIVARGEFDLPD